MPVNQIITLTAFLMASSLVLLLSLVMGGRKVRVFKANGEQVDV